MNEAVYGAFCDGCRNTCPLSRPRCSYGEEQARMWSAGTHPLGKQPVDLFQDERRHDDWIDEYYEAQADALNEDLADDPLHGEDATSPIRETSGDGRPTSNIPTCPGCPRGCSLDAPSCARGDRFAKQWQQGLEL